MIYSLLDGKKTIEISHLSSALAFWQYCEDSAKFIFSGWGSNPAVVKIMNYISTKPRSKTDLFRLFKNKIRKEMIDDSLKELIASGRIISSEIKTGSKNKIIYISS
jgi:hypothetical protein